jgi:hypothetical protein
MAKLSYVADVGASKLVLLQGAVRDFVLGLRTLRLADPCSLQAEGNGKCKAKLILLGFPLALLLLLRLLRLLLLPRCLARYTRSATCGLGGGLIYFKLWPSHELWRREERGGERELDIKACS